ncbi:hypothetical protein BD310DRAFT_959744 [Dichomitus squalens]|uniref:F-box domain-containing protein n=1 Tax=Dichomitus squalens TaxID=114155 RepID=A0A4V2K7S5_9APHY|nr:hypothetical protein BD310DRAFT_959744 [Dichomitus squalens]
MSASPRLPWEVIERTISHSGDDRTTLQSFSLTCKQLRPRSLCLMFDEVPFISQRQRTFWPSSTCSGSSHLTRIFTDGRSHALSDWNSDSDSHSHASGGPGDALRSTMAFVAILGNWWFPHLPLDPIGGLGAAQDSDESCSVRRISFPPLPSCCCALGWAIVAR